ncbi:hypothetical protein CKR_1355 [Clostridium kluyveri NBRC 12016]|nr:transcriptional regulator [Clostridium kluyveri]BAH06406.1 hypothetical protein CKR_1355 [Clostridium kluyveri NBRC 12016]
MGREHMIDSNIENDYVQDMVNYLILVHEKLSKPFEDCFKEKLSALQFNTLCVLRSYGSLTMRELAERMNLSKQQMTKIIAKLVKINFAERNYDKDDRRIIKISATKEADEYIKLESKAFARRLKDIVNSLNEEDLKDLENAIKSMNKILPKFPKWLSK